MSISEVDNNLYSRQIGAIGKESMKKLVNISVMFIGCDTITLEAMKCLVLMGVRNFVIYDMTPVTQIFAARFINYYTYKGVVASDYIENFIKDLVPNVNIKVIRNQTFINDIDRYFRLPENIVDCVIHTNETISTDLSSFELIQNTCMKYNIKYIAGFNNALLGYIFCNFNNHTILDVNGEIPSSVYIEKYDIVHTKIELYVEKNIDFKYTNEIIISNKKNNKLTIKVNNYYRNIFEVDINDQLLNMLRENSNLEIIELKETINIQHQPFNTYINNKSYNYITLNSSFNRNDELYTEYLKYLASPYKLLPKLFDKMQMNSKFYPIGCIIGGIIAQEVIKLTGKYTPLTQDILINFDDLRSPYITFPKNCPTYDLLCNLDREIVNQIKNKYIFMVGCGALGCELSKNLAMMNFCQNTKSMLFVTDMDNISYSNLSRQFMFGAEDVGRPKSLVINEKINYYSPKTKIKNYNLEVSNKTENEFNSKFWDNLDFIVNALDNVEARKYIDSKTVMYSKPLFESGTLGAKCSTQMIIPYKTATYSELTDPTENSIPMCTIHNFPNKIEHCIQWCLDLFDKIVTSPISDLIDICNSYENYVRFIDSIGNTSLIYDRLSNLYQLLLLIDNNTMTGLQDYTYYVFDKMYYKNIKIILESFPETLKDEFGKPFWTGKRLKPILPDFNNYKDSLTKSFHNIYKSVLKLPNAYEYVEKEYSQSSDIKKTVVVDISKQLINIEIDNSNIVNLKKDIFNLRKKIINKIHGLDLTMMEYDKDDLLMSQLMMDLTNIRADIYNINKIDLIDTQLISGKIIPALCSTTTVISGFVMMDIFKYLCNKKNTDTNINLGTNQYIIFDSNKPKVTYDGMFHNAYGFKISTIPESFTSWNNININAKTDDCYTVDSLINILADYKIKPIMITYNNTIIYEEGSNLNYSKEYLDVIMKKNNYKTYGKIQLNITMFNEMGLPVLTPAVLYSF